KIQRKTKRRARPANARTKRSLLDDPSDSAIHTDAQTLLPGLIGNPYLIPNTNRIYANEKKMKIARDILERYTGSPANLFRKQIILTNFEYYLERFHTQCGDERF